MAADLDEVPGIGRRPLAPLRDGVRRFHRKHDGPRRNERVAPGAWPVEQHEVVGVVARRQLDLLPTPAVPGLPHERGTQVRGPRPIADQLDAAPWVRGRRRQDPRRATELGHAIQVVRVRPRALPALCGEPPGVQREDAVEIRRAEPRVGVPARIFLLESRGALGKRADPVEHAGPDDTGTQRIVGPPRVAAPMALLESHVVVAACGIVLVDDITMAVRCRAVRKAARYLAVLQRLGIVAVEEDLAQDGVVPEDLQRRADVGAPGEEVPVVLEVHEPGRAHRLPDQVEAARVAAIGGSLENELEERKESAHLVPVRVVGVVVDADEPVDQVDVGAGIQERVHSADEQVEPTATCDGKRHAGIERGRPRREAGDETGVVTQKGVLQSGHREVAIPLDAPALAVGQIPAVQQFGAQRE
ncbi:MAG: hypothetical protein IPI73_00735 [Betaproteobacteria bacterium]|nr:hypothetical protein [Betaproteobacteria bacterium]